MGKTWHLPPEKGGKSKKQRKKSTKQSDIDWDWPYA